MFRRKTPPNSDRDDAPGTTEASTPSAAGTDTPAGGSNGNREVFTIVYRGTTVVGDIEAEGRIRVYGTVRGAIRTGGTLEVAESGYVEGDTLEVDVIKILGHVKADVVARGKVEIWKGGVLEGDVEAAALDIEEGASFTGRSEMRDLGVTGSGADDVRRRSAGASNGRGGEADSDSEPAPKPTTQHTTQRTSQRPSESASESGSGVVRESVPNAAG